VRHLNIIVAASIDGGELHEENASVVIPPGYDAADIRALVVRKIEDTAFALTTRDFGRAPTRQALIAAVARIRAIENVLDDPHGPDGTVPITLRIRAIIGASNADITRDWGEHLEGE